MTHLESLLSKSKQLREAATPKPWGFASSERSFEMLLANYLDKRIKLSTEIYTIVY